MEYDKFTTEKQPDGPAPPSDSAEKTNSTRETLRIQSEKVDVSLLAESITFPFSGRTAPNRFLKAPMTERLCHWNKEGEDIVRIIP